MFSIQYCPVAGVGQQDNIILPDGTPGILWILDGALERQAEGSTPDSITKTVVFGQKTESVRYRFGANPLYCVGLKLHPCLLPLLLREEAACLNDAYGDLVSIGNTPNLSWIKSCINKTRGEVAFARTQAYLNFISANAQLPTVDQLATYFKRSPRSLQRHFVEDVGMPPKMYLRIIRLNRLVAQARRNPTINLLHLAIDFGFHDQNHFIKEIKHFTGMSPRQFFGREIAEVEWNHQRFIQQFTTV